MITTTLTDVLTQWFVYELQGDGFDWDPVSARYRDRTTGRYIADSQVVGLTEGYSDFRAGRMEQITQRHIDGKIGIQEWQSQMRQQIKDVHIMSATAGRGGREPGVEEAGRSLHPEDRGP